ALPLEDGAADRRRPGRDRPGRPRGRGCPRFLERGVRRARAAHGPAVWPLPGAGVLRGRGPARAAPGRRRGAVASILLNRSSPLAWALSRVVEDGRAALRVRLWRGGEAQLAVEVA